MLTDAQRRVLDFIQRRNTIQIVPPMLREIATRIGFRPLKTGSHRSESTLPLFGKIAAGKPVEAIPGQDGIDLSDFFGKNNFAIRVQGDSMIEAGILDGDTVIIEFRETANDGDIVVALIDECETTLKRFKRSRYGNYIKLIPANAEMEPMIYEAERVRIQGVLIGQLRKY